MYWVWLSAHTRPAVSILRNSLVFHFAGSSISDSFIYGGQLWGSTWLAISDWRILILGYTSIITDIYCDIVDIWVNVLSDILISISFALIGPILIPASKCLCALDSLRDCSTRFPGYVQSSWNIVGKWRTFLKISISILSTYDYEFWYRPIFWHWYRERSNINS